MDDRIDMPDSMKPPRSFTALLLVALALVACSDGSQRRTPESAAAASPGSTNDASRRASDASLALLDLAGLGTELRAATDSFEAREAVRVVYRADGSTESGTLTDSALVGGRAPDIVVADLSLFPQRIVPASASWYAPFASDRIVIAYLDSTSRAAAIDSTNWWKVLTRRGVRVARSDPDGDASGRNALLTMQLAEQKYQSRGLAAKLRASASIVRSSRSGIVTLLRVDSADYIWTYESVAAAAGLHALRLPHDIDLGEVSDSAVYSTASIAIPNHTVSARDSLAPAIDSLVMRGAPIVYAVSIPLDAPNPSVAARFARFLLSSEGQRALLDAHLNVPTRVLAIGTDVPAPVASVVDSVVLAVDSTAARSLDP